MLMPNAFPRYVACQFVKAQRNREPFFTRHTAVGFQLFFESKVSMHDHFLWGQSIPLPL